ncbi:MAG TPA: response regulator transcription factor [Gallionella sp.]|nr:response regulator transcription factor [Gallionella sp.]
MINVLIADDHVIMRNGLKQLCEDMGDIAVIGEARNGDEVLELLGQQRCDLLLLDLTMPGVSGVDLIERIRVRDANLPILVFSMRNEVQVAKCVLQAGATGYLTKGGDEEILMSAIRKVAAGEHFVDPCIVEQSMFTKKAPAGTSSHGRLSEREVQILTLIAQGKNLTDIAAELFISIKTVSTHKKHLMLKMNFQSNADLMIYAVENGLNKA